MERDPGQSPPRRTSGKRPTLAGVEVREEDLSPMPGLNFVSNVFRVSAIVILLLGLWQFADWWLDRPPGNVGLAVLVADTIRLVVFAALLWAASSLASLIIRSHYDLRATRILASRCEYILRQMAVHAGAIDRSGDIETTGERRGVEPSELTGDNSPG